MLENDINFTNLYPSAKRFDFTARKGDILIWDSLTIHGALMPKDLSMTRKSITSHFYPTGVAVQSPPIKRFFSIYNHEKPHKTMNSNIFKATTIRPLVYQSICFGLFILEKTQRIKNLLIRERDDKVSHIRRL